MLHFWATFPIKRMATVGNAIILLPGTRARKCQDCEEMSNVIKTNESGTIQGNGK